MKAIIIGDSHTAALKLGMDLLISQGGLPKGYQIDVLPLAGADSMLAPYFIDKGDFAEMTNWQHKKRIQRLPFPDEVEHYDYYGICGPLHASKLWRHRLKSYWPGHTPFSPQNGLAPVSTSMLRHIVLQEQAHTLKLIELLKRVGIKPFVIEAPKPFRHHPILEFVDPKTISFLDNVYKKIVMEWLAAKKVPIIQVPDACYDADGFMYDTFRHDAQTDNLHANEQFGVIMVNEIIEFLASTD